MYVTAGYRIGKFTPSITWQERDGDNDIKFLEEIARLPAPVQQAVAPLAVGLQVSNAELWSTLTLGLRYDMSSQIALKAELIDYTDDITSSQDANLIRFAVNYVF
jgi:hypothetical protein